MPRGRKKDFDIPQTRALVTQRAYRARKAAYVNELEDRLRTTEEENEHLREQLAIARADPGQLGYNHSRQTAEAAAELFQSLAVTQNALNRFTTLAFDPGAPVGAYPRPSGAPPLPPGPEGAMYPPAAGPSTRPSQEIPVAPPFFAPGAVPRYPSEAGIPPGAPLGLHESWPPVPAARPGPGPGPLMPAYPSASPPPVLAPGPSRTGPSMRPTSPPEGPGSSRAGSSSPMPLRPSRSSPPSGPGASRVSIASLLGAPSAAARHASGQGSSSFGVDLPQGVGPYTHPAATANPLPWPIQPVGAGIGPSRPYRAPSTQTRSPSASSSPSDENADSSEDEEDSAAVNPSSPPAPDR